MSGEQVDKEYEMTKPTGVHHIALSTAHMKEQLMFFTQVLGMELVALYWMHGVDGAWHSFLKLNNRCSLSFIYLPGTEEIEPQVGVSHAGNASSACAGGTLQHLSLRVENVAELLEMRDRIRSHGIPVFGAIEHGMCSSIYFAGPEGLNLEVATPEIDFIDPDAWIDPEVVALSGITQEDLKVMITPPAFTPKSKPVPQPEYDPDKPHMNYPEEIYRKMLAATDAKFSARSRFTQTPVSNSNR